MTAITPPQVAATAGVSPDTSRLATHGNLEAAGQRFEAIFTGMMLKSMRAAKLGEGLFDNKAGEQFRDMMDTKIAENMSVHAPMGIGRALVDFLAKSEAAPDAKTDGNAS